MSSAVNQGEENGSRRQRDECHSLPAGQAEQFQLSVAGTGHAVRCTIIVRQPLLASKRLLFLLLDARYLL
jgi:hypothetical protein